MNFGDKMKSFIFLLINCFGSLAVADTVTSYTSMRFGGIYEERAQGIAVLNNGDYLITGYTFSADLPCTGTIRPNHHNPPTQPGYDQWGFSDAFVARFNGNTHNLQWCTYLGGSKEDRGYHLRADSTHVYVTGVTTSDDFDSTVNATTQDHAIFISKLSLDGQSIAYTTLIDGSGKEWIRNGIAISLNTDSSANYIYLTGETQSPTLLGSSLRGAMDGIVVRINALDGSIDNAQRIGGSGSDSAWGGIALSASGDVFITGHTESSDLLSFHLDSETAAQMLQPNFGGHQQNNGDWMGDIFIARLSPDLAIVHYITYLGGSRLDGSSVNNAITVDSLGRAYVIADTRSVNPNTDNLFPLAGVGVEKSWHFPPLSLTGAPLSPSVIYDENLYDSALVIIASDGKQVLASTVIGGSRGDESSGVAIDEAGRIWVTGNTNSNDITTTTDALMNQYTPPVGPPQYPWFSDNEYGPDWLISVYSPDLSTVLFRSYLGGDGNALTGDVGRSIQTNPNLPNQVWISGATDTAVNSLNPFPVDISNGPLGVPSDAIVLHINTSPYQNAVPVVNAGIDQTIYTSTLPVQLQLNGVANDSDGLLQNDWSTISQPNGVSDPIFLNATQLQTQVTIGEYGSYTIRLSSSDALNYVFDEINITINSSDLIFKNTFEN